MRYDVIIVGAGPGGSVAASAAAKLGLRTFLVDKATFPRDKVCGDAVSGKCLTVMRRLSMSGDLAPAGGNPISGITFGVPSDDSISIPFKLQDDGPSAFTCRRIDFDHLLFSRAVASGIDVAEGREVAGLLRGDGATSGRWIDSGATSGRRLHDRGAPDGPVIGITLKGKSKSGVGTRIHAPVVIGADGAHSIVARSVGLPAHPRNHLAAGIRAYYEGVETDGAFPSHFEIHYLKETAPGYFWIFPLGNGRANLGVGMLSRDLRRQNVRLKDLLRRCLGHPRFQTRFERLRRDGEIKGWTLPLGSQPRRMTGDGWMLVGDAAGLIDPFTGEGIANAMIGGRMAAEAAHRAHEAGDFSAARLAGYENELLAKIQPELRLSTGLQRLTRLPSVLSFIVRRAQRSNGLTDVLSGMFEDVNLRRQLVSPAFYLRIMRGKEIALSKRRAAESEVSGI